MGNRYAIADAIKKEMGEDTQVVHGMAYPFTVVSEVDGQMGVRECLPMYFNCPVFVSKCMCAGSIEHTAKNAANITAGAPGAHQQMQR